MAELVAEVLALHNTLHTDRSQTEALKAERDRLIQCQHTTNKRCQQLEEEANRLQKMLATRNGALSQELGLQPSYNKCLVELAGQPYNPEPARHNVSPLIHVKFAEANSKFEQLSSKRDQEVNDIHLKLKHSEASQAHLASMLSVEKQAHAVTAASLKQTQEKNIREVQQLEAKVMIDAFAPNQKCHK